MGNDFKYQITYKDPKDESARRVKAWKFKTLKEARAWREDLAIVWGKIPPKDIPIEKIESEARK